MSARGLAICVLVMLALTACDTPVASVENPLSDQCWFVSDSLSLSWENTDADRQLFASCQFADAYEFSNIYLWIEVLSPSGKSWKRPLEYDLMDEKGNWFGKGEAHRGLALPLTLKGELTEKGKYTFRLTHHMQDNRLCGIESIGLEIR